MFALLLTGEPYSVNMELKLKQLKSTEKLDYNGYKKLAKTTWATLSPSNTLAEYALVAGEYLSWKNAKPEDLNKQPLLYVGSTNKWQQELKGHPEMKLEHYSYGTCKVVQKGAHICVQLLPTKGKLTQKKLLKPIQKELKKFKPKVFLEVVSAFEEQEELSTQELEDRGIEEVKEQLQFIKKFEELIEKDHGSYKAWLGSFDAIRTSRLYRVQAAKVVAPATQTLIVEFLNLYNELPKSKRRPYKSTAVLVKDYKKTKVYVQKWLDNVNAYNQIMINSDALYKEYEGLEINNSEEDIILIPKEKMESMKAMIAKIQIYQQELKIAPAVLSKYAMAQSRRFSNSVRVLKLGLERTVQNMEDTKVQPLAHPDHSNYALKRIIGPLFEQPTNNPQEPLVSDNDVLQGRLGDCYLMASLIGLAKKCPEIIRQAIVEKKNGNKTTYEVTLYFLDAQDKTKLVPQKVHIDNQFMVNTTGNSAYASQGDQGELWPLVIEKAMAKALGGYKELAGGNTEWALRMLTGEFPSTRLIQQGKEGVVKDTKVEEIIELLQANQGKLITVAIGKPDKGGHFFEIRKSSETIEEHLIEFGGEILYCNHAYVIDAVDYSKLAKAGAKEGVITLYNPHNTAQETIKFPKVSPQLLKHIATKITIL